MSTEPDKVYILSHGSALGSQFVGARRGAKKVYEQGLPKWKGGTMQKYSPDELADLLEGEGLPTDFKDLRVFSCGSGLVLQGTVVAFAQGLAQALRGLQYNNIKVTGCLGAVKASYASRQVPDSMGKYTDEKHKGVIIDGEIFPASTQKVVF